MSMRVGIASVVLTAIVVASGCNADEGSGTSDPELSSGVVAPDAAIVAESTALETTTTLPQTGVAADAEIEYERLSPLDVGEVRPVKVWGWCGVTLEFGDERSIDEIDVADRDIVPYPGRDWRASDFPSDWDVVVFNEGGEDGPSWVILDATVERLDATTLEAKDRSGALIALFELDPTPLDERIGC